MDNTPPLPTTMTVVHVELGATAHGPIDGRHVIILPDDDICHEDRAEIAQMISDHFLEATEHLVGDEPERVARYVPLVIFGDARIEPAVPTVVNINNHPGNED